MQIYLEQIALYVIKHETLKQDRPDTPQYIPFKPCDTHKTTETNTGWCIHVSGSPIALDFHLLPNTGRKWLSLCYEGTHQQDKVIHISNQFSADMVQTLFTMSLVQVCT